MKSAREICRKLTTEKEDAIDMEIAVHRTLLTINPHKPESAERNDVGGSGAADERRKKIAAITEQIRKGTYRVDPELVAKKILEKMKGTVRQLR